jgi:hypothetical protein
MNALYEEDVASKGGGGVTNPVAVWRDNIGRKFQFFLDKSTPHPVARWVGSLVVAAIFGLRAYYINGFYIVTYGLGIYLLNLLIGFLSPQVDPEIEDPGLPSKATDEFKPFIRRLPEFKFWYALTKAFLVAFVLTFFSIFDVPVFWPILLLYWLVLFVLTMKRQIRHMIKYRYVPFTVGKQRYTGKGPSSSDQVMRSSSEESMDAAVTLQPISSIDNAEITVESQSLPLQV